MDTIIGNINDEMDICPRRTIMQDVQVTCSAHVSGDIKNGFCEAHSKVTRVCLKSLTQEFRERENLSQFPSRPQQG